MNRRTKASSSGSTLRQGNRLGAIIRRAFATRGASDGAKGSGAPSVVRGSLALAPVLALAAFIALALPAAASAAEPTVTVEPITEYGSTTARPSGKFDLPPDSRPAFLLGFQYSTDGVNWTSAPSPDDNTVFLPGATGIVSTEMIGLEPETTYQVRIKFIVGLSNEEFISEVKEFTTSAPVDFVAPTITDLLTSQVSSSTAHLAAQIDPGGSGDIGFDTRWHFECTPACSGLKGGTVPAGASAEVGADATNLRPATTYNLRLVASNAGGEVEEVATFKTAPIPPLVISFDADPVDATSAEIHGEVNPGGSDTSYWFEWGTADCSANPCQSLPSTRDSSAGAGTAYRYFSTQLSGLSPGATYHFRIVARNDQGTVPGPDTEFTTPAVEAACQNEGALGTARLPDCRAWEMASPADKNGGDVVPATQRTRAAIDGSAVNYTSLVGAGDVHGGTIGTEYLAQRTAAPGTSGWQTHGITPAQNPLPISGAPFLDPDYDLLSADLSAGVFRASRPLAGTPDRIAGQLNLYTRKDLGTPGPGSYQVISDPGFAVAPLAFPQVERPYIAGASSDLSHVIFESNLPLDKSADLSSCNAFFGCPGQLFESVGGAVRLVGRIPPTGQSECDDATEAPACEAAPSSRAGLGAADTYWTPHMISADGSRVFFQAGGNAYMRVNGTTTVQLNASERSTPEGGAQDTKLWIASDDGSRVFFNTGEGLVNEDKDHADDYYMYDVNAPSGHHLTLVSRDGEPDVVDSPSGIVGASEDGHYLYFMMSGQLVPGEDPIVQGIYVWHDGDIHFIGGSDTGINSLAGSWGLISTTTAARVSADGSHVIFVTGDGAPLKGRGGFTGYDQGGARELYVYSADSGKLRCASCDPSGAPPTGNVQVNVDAENYSSATSNTPYLHRAISADGRWAFFSSPDRLVPEDTNGKFDAYSYDTVNDEVHLLSSGTSDDDSYFMDASADGRDAFFTTREQLVGWDTDKSLDLYDARVGGGVPEPAPVPAPCEGDSCHAASAVAPGAAPLGSTQPGLGNPKQPRRCAKGKHSARKAGKTRCVTNRNKRNAKTNRRAGR